MKIIEPYYRILTPIDREMILKNIEYIGRVCYKSEDKITEDSATMFIRTIIKNGHEAVIEHISLTIKFICDRGISHEIVRHRLASYCQESTRYCNYSKDKFDNEIVFIAPPFYNKDEDGVVLNNKSSYWSSAMSCAEHLYLSLLKNGATPQEARSVLPNSLKTEIVMTANLREWRHFLKLRTDKAAHPQMRQLTVPLLKELQEKLPEIFSDIKSE